MANKYWYQSGVDALWDTLTDNWWDDAGHSSQSAGLPVAGDSLYFLGSTAPDTGPALSTNFALLDTTGLAVAWTMDANVTVGDNGTLNIGDASDVHEFTGTTGHNCTATFHGLSKQTGTITGNCTFNDSSYMSGGTINSNAGTWGSILVYGAAYFAGNSNFASPTTLTLKRSTATVKQASSFATASGTLNIAVDVFRYLNPPTE